jgi:succinate dehydrogenase/fumarate reductase flavoprotein subunit
MEDQTSWHHTADVVVVGFGAAGAVAAITAHDHGAHVLILEKQPEETHLSTSSMSGGAFICPADVPAATQYMEHLSKVDEELWWTDRETLRVWAEYASQNRQWVETLGANVGLRTRGGEHDVPGSDSIEVYQFRGRGRGLMKFFKRQVEMRKIQVMYETEADTLVTNDQREIGGVGVKRNGQSIRIRAAQAVIMALGGFEFNEEMKLNYLKAYPTYFAGSPANTGDGIRMVQTVEASLWQRGAIPVATSLSIDTEKGIRMKIVNAIRYTMNSLSTIARSWNTLASRATGSLTAGESRQAPCLSCFTGPCFIVSSGGARTIGWKLKRDGLRRETRLKNWLIN